MLCLYTKSVSRAYDACMLYLWSSHIIARVRINRVRLPIPLSWSAEQVKCFFLFRSFAPEILISIPRLNLVLTYGIPPECRGGVHLFI